MVWLCVTIVLLLCWSTLEKVTPLYTSTRFTSNKCNCTISAIKTPGCYLRLDTTEGYLESPHYPDGYPPGLDCRYDVARPSSEYCGIKLYAELFQVRKYPEDDEFCHADYLAMDSCVPEGGSRFCGNLTGAKFHYLFQPGARAIRFIFHSSVQHPDYGLYRYRLKYDIVTDCTGLFQEALVAGIPGESESLCYIHISDRRGFISSPYHPDSYPHNLDCVYEFIRSDPFICGVRMKSVKFNLEPSMWTPFGGACSDYMQSPGCGFLCGDLNFVWTSLYQPGATSQKFHFHTDEVNSAQGFLISYEQLYHCARQEDNRI